MPIEDSLPPSSPGNSVCGFILLALFEMKTHARAGEFLCCTGTLSGQDLDKTRFQMRWGIKFIDAAREGKCRIINYPTALRDANQIIGSVAFALKKIKSATFETFMDELVKANTSSSTSDDDNNIMRLVCWNDGK
jgi:hypothetical protein